MAAKIDIFSYDGETLIVEFFAKARDGATLSSPESQTVELAIASDFGAAPEATLTGWSLADAAEARYVGTFQNSALAALQVDQVYKYNLWTQAPTEDPILQARGSFRRYPTIRA